MSDHNPSTAGKELSKVPADKAFYVHNGGQITGLKELAESLETMPDESFAYHVSSEKNDFANWVNDILMDENLAKELRKTQNKGKMARLVKKRLEKLETVHNIDKFGSGYAVRSAVMDFLIGIVVGVIIGLIVAAVV